MIMSLMFATRGCSFCGKCGGVILIAMQVLLSAWFRPGAVPVSNEDVAEYTKAHPDRFVGVGSVDLYKPQEAVKEIERCVKEYGFKGDVFLFVC